MYKSTAKNIQRCIESSGGWKTGPKYGLSDRNRKKAKRIKVGFQYKGRVIKLLDRGAVIDIAGIWAFLHISEISIEWIDHPSKILSANQYVNVWVTSNETDSEGRLSIKLTMKGPPSVEIQKKKRHKIKGRLSTKLTKKGPPSVEVKTRKRHKIKTHNKDEAYKWEYEEALKEMGVRFSDSASYGELERLYKKEYKKAIEKL